MDAATLGRLVPAGFRPVLRRQLVRFRRRGLVSNDVLLVSYPKSGSTWLRMLMGMTLSGTELDFDSVRIQLPPLGAHHRAPSVLNGGGRFLRTHEPLDWLEPLPCRVLYLVRDGRDVAASYYHHVMRVGRFSGTPSEFVDSFLAGRIDGYGTWSDHVVGAAQRRADETMTVLRYEDLRADTAGAVARVCAQLSEDVAEARIRRAIDANTKQRMLDKERTSRRLAETRRDATNFVRPDGAPGWREIFPADRVHRLESALQSGLAEFGYR